MIKGCEFQLGTAVCPWMVAVDLGRLPKSVRLSIMAVRPRDVRRYLITKLINYLKREREPSILSLAPASQRMRTATDRHFDSHQVKILYKLKTQQK